MEQMDPRVGAWRWVEFAEQNTAFRFMVDGHQESRVEVPVSPGKLSSAWRVDYPTAADLEEAIQRVEDALESQRVLRNSGTEALRVVHGPTAAALGVTKEPAVLDTASVERVFTRLVETAVRRGRTPDAVPSNLELAGVLFLREMMHHLHFPKAHVEPGT